MLLLREDFNPAATRTGTTLGGMVREFQRIYDLPDGQSEAFTVGHDGVHVMSGMGITIADELRVDIYISTLACDRVSDFDAFLKGLHNDADHLYNSLKKHNAAPEAFKLAAEPTKLDTGSFARVLLGSEMLSRDEIAAQAQLALEMNTTIRQLTGKRYTGLTTEEIKALDLTGIDFSARAYAIKNAYETPANAQVEQRGAEVLHAAATAQGRGHDIPHPGTPWHGAARRPFRI